MFSSMAGVCNDPAWGENLDTIRLQSMIIFNSTGYKKSLLFILIQVENYWYTFLLPGMEYYCVVLLLPPRLFSPQ